MHPTDDPTPSRGSDSSVEAHAPAGRWLLMLETGSNQEYIFVTNRTRENVGASHLTVLATSRWLDEALDRCTKRCGETPFEVVQQISGSALVLFAEGRRDEAERVAAEVTLQALARAPGLDLAAAIVDAPEPAASTAKPLSEAIRRASATVAENRAARPGPGARHPRLPLTADCTSSAGGASAEQLLPKADGWRARSAASIAKRTAGDAGLARISEEVGQLTDDSRLARSADELERLLEDDSGRFVADAGGEMERDGKPKRRSELSWLAVVHADGNGVGEILAGLAAEQDGRSYLRALATFSRTLEGCGSRAFASAAAGIPPVEGVVPVVPLVLGGDDLTALVPGRAALRFTVTYLRKFEEETARHLGELAPGGRLSACAGVAITKPHHPFSDSYRLAEHLADSAKRVKRIVQDHEGRRLPCSAIDFHLLYDSIVGEVEDVRRRLRIPGRQGDAVLTAKPYVVSDLSDERRWASATDPVRAWLAAHDYALLEGRRKALLAPDPRDPVRAAIPRSQVLALRGAVQEGVEAADARTALATARHPKLATVVEHRDGKPSLFEPRPEADMKIDREGTDRDDPPVLHSRLLDALDVAELESEAEPEPEEDAA